MCTSWWRNIGHSVALIHIDHMMVIILHNLWLYGFSSLIAEINFCWGIVNIRQHANVSLVLPQYCCQVSTGSYMNVSHSSVLLSSVLRLLAWLSFSACQCRNTKSVSWPNHQIIQGKKRNCPCIICGHILLSSLSILSLSHGLLSSAVLCTVCPSPHILSCHKCIHLSHKSLKILMLKCFHFFCMCCLKPTLPLMETVTSSIARFLEGL